MVGGVSLADGRFQLTVIDFGPAVAVTPVGAAGLANILRLRCGDHGPSPALVTALMRTS